MKKFKFAASLLGLAMLGACSSDAPEMNPNQDAEETGMYLAINIVGESTRAQTSVETLATEENIEKLQIFILDENENLYFTKTCPKSDITGGIAKFTVTTATYNDMIAKYNRGAQMKIVLYANGTTLSTSEQVMHGSTSDPTWGVLTDYGQNKVNNVGAFIMSNAEDCTGSFDDPNGADGSEAKPWLIKTNVKLARLATRFEYGKDNLPEYKALHEQGLTMKVAGFDVETFATSTYRVSLFSVDGTKPETFVSGENANHGHYKESTSFPYRVTDSYSAGDEFGIYTDYNYVITDGTPYTYVRPNTVSKNYTFLDTKEDFKKVPFAVVKAEFSCTDFAGTETASASMAAGDKVYAVNGIFLGGFKDFKALRAKYAADNTFRFKINYKDGTTDGTKFSESDKAKIKLVEDNYNMLLTRSLPSEYDASKNDADDELYFRNAWTNAEVYSAVDGKYYTYYGVLIQTRKNDADKYWRYGVSRNLSYALAVSSFKWLGNNGEGHPGDGPTSADLSDMAIQLSVEVNKWGGNFANTSMEL